MSSDPVTVTVPARAGNAGILRLVAGSSGVEAELPIDRLDELALAVDEAATALLDAGARSNLTCVVHDHDGLVSVEVSADLADSEWPPPGWAGSIGAMVLEGIATDVTLERAASGSAVVSFSITPRFGRLSPRSD